MSKPNIALLLLSNFYVCCDDMEESVPESKEAWFQQRPAREEMAPFTGEG